MFLTDVRHMYEEYTSGKTMKQVGDVFGCSKQHVSKLFKRYGYAARGQHSMVEVFQTKRDILDFIRSFRKEHGISPTYEEIAVGIGRSPEARSNIFSLVKNLIDEGYIKQAASGSRALVVTRKRYKMAVDRMEEEQTGN